MALLSTVRVVDSFPGLPKCIVSFAGMSLMIISPIVIRLRAARMNPRDQFAMESEAALYRL